MLIVAMAMGMVGVLREWPGDMAIHAASPPPQSTIPLADWSPWSDLSVIGRTQGRRLAVYRQRGTTWDYDEPNNWGLDLWGQLQVLRGSYTDWSSGRSFERADVFGRDGTGQLIHYWWTEFTGGWAPENLTAKTGGVSLATDPVAVQTYETVGRPRHDVYGRDANGNLLHYWWTMQQGWRFENLTTLTGGPGLTGTVDVVTAGLGSTMRQDVFGRTSAGDVVHY
jgi:hypothetical protein